MSLIQRNREFANEITGDLKATQITIEEYCKVRALGEELPLMRHVPEERYFVVLCDPYTREHFNCRVNY